jgi:hypothetical protein
MCVYSSSKSESSFEALCEVSIADFFVSCCSFVSKGSSSAPAPVSNMPQELRGFTLSLVFFYLTGMSRD